MSVYLKNSSKLFPRVYDFTSHLVWAGFTVLCVDSLLLRGSQLQPNSSWLPPQWAHLARQVGIIVLNAHNPKAVDTFSPPTTCIAPLEALRDLADWEETVCSTPALFMFLGTNVYGVLSNSVLSSSPGRQPREVPRACVVWEVSGASLSQQFT